MTVELQVRCNKADDSCVHKGCDEAQWHLPNTDWERMPCTFEHLCQYSKKRGIVRCTTDGEDQE